MRYIAKLILVIIGATMLKMEVLNRQEKGQDWVVDLLGLVLICSTWVF